MAGISLALRALRALELGDDEPSSPSPPPPPSVRDAALAALARGETHYTDRPGILPLRERVATWLASDQGVPSDPGSVVITCGASEGRFVAVQELLEPGETLLCLGDANRVAGAALVRGCELLAADPLPDDADLTGVGCLYLDAERYQRSTDAHLLDLARDRGWWLLVDLPTGANSDHPVADADLLARTVTIGDIGLDAGMAGWRIGYLSAPTDAANGLRSFKQALTICTTNLSQWGALALFEGAP
jgi:aspartate aminotransferase